MIEAARRRAVAWVAVAAIVALLGSQAAAEAVAPRPLEGQNAAVGQAGFAYAASLRRFAAAVLWNRLEPQFHEYYSGTGLRDMTFLLPNTAIIVALDPQLINAYYVAPFILYERGRETEALALAEEGVRNNPDSARLRASYAQLLQITGDLDAAVAQADAAMRGEWGELADEGDGLTMILAVYQAAGRTADVAEVTRQLRLLEAQLEGSSSGVEHDHDGDGRPDH